MTIGKTAEGKQFFQVNDKSGRLLLGVVVDFLVNALSVVEHVFLVEYKVRSS